MKKSFLLLIALIVSIVAAAGTVTPDEARKNVAKFMNPRRAAAVIQNREALRLVHTSYYKAQEHVLAPSYYVFNVGHDEGYIIAAADDRVPAVLGYSDRGAVDPDNMPANMKAWLQGYDRQMAYLNSHPEAVVPRRTVSGEAIAPLLGAIKWNQRSPYNDLCPLDEGVRSLAGCVATAMGQIMCYWEYPAATTSLIPGYTTKRKEFQLPAIDAGTPIDWNNMLPQYTGNETEAQKQAVANLMLMCGTAVEMDYSKEFSGAIGLDAATALCNYFDYDLATTFKIHNYYRAAEWNQMVYDELKAGRPVYYDGQSSGSGHAFVVDGYGGDDYFHVNWGWGGAGNDYFLLSVLDPKNKSGAGASQSADGYNMDQGAIFGAQPNTGIIPTEDIVLTTTAIVVLDSTEYVRSGIDSNFVFDVGVAFFNHTASTYNVDTGIGLYNNDGTLLGVVEGPSGELLPRYGIWNPADCPYTLTLGRDWESMEFTMSPLFRLHGTADWKPMKDADINYVAGAFKGDTLKLSEPAFGLTGTLAATGKKEVNYLLPVTAKIINDGSLYRGSLFFMVDEKLVGGCHFDLAQGDSATVDFSFIPEKAGRFGVSVCTRTWNVETQQNDYIPFIADSIDVAAPAVADLAVSYSVENITDKLVRDNFIKLKVNAKNNGTTDYDNAIRVQGYKDNRDGSGIYGFFKEISKDVQIEAGDSVDVDFTFDNLEDNNYLFLVSYLSEGEWQDDQTEVYSVYTGPIPELIMTLQTTNAVEENGTWVVKTDSAIVSVLVKNIGTCDYDDDITVTLCKSIDEDNGSLVSTAHAPVRLAAGADTTVVVQLGALEDGVDYYCDAYYWVGRIPVYGNEHSAIFSAKFEEQGIQLVNADAPANGTAYNLAGQQVAPGFRGLVIRNGKKVLVR